MVWSRTVEQVSHLAHLHSGWGAKGKRRKGGSVVSRMWARERRGAGATHRSW